MKAAQLSKYGFRIRTRTGAIVDNLTICGRDASDAERKLLQIYLGCEILAANCLPATSGRGVASYEDVVDLIAR